MVSIPPKAPPITSLTTHFTRKIKGKQKSTRRRLKRKKKVRDKKKNKAPVFKPQVKPKFETKLFQTRNDFQSRKKTILTSPDKTKVPVFQEQSRGKADKVQMKILVIKLTRDDHKTDPDLHFTDHMTANWRLSPQRTENPGNPDQEWQTPKVVIPSRSGWTALEHGRPPENITRTTRR